MINKTYACRLLLISLSIPLLYLSCGKRAETSTKEPVRAANFSFRGKPGSTILFLSTQMNPVEEAEKMRDVILKDFPGQVDFMPNDNGYLSRQINSMLSGEPKDSILVGALHGDLVKLFEGKELRPLDDIFGDLSKRGFSGGLVKLSRLNGRNVYYVPWMQASFVMVANKKALAYLPHGADLDSLTYAQLDQWAANIFERTGKKPIGFPAGGKGLMHRFFQGYLYPSFTASTLLKFRSPDAKAMWAYFKDLWRYSNPGSLVFSTMSEPLLTGDVWIAWDHTARLVKAFDERPDDFVAFPAPIGPKGRGFMSVVSGLAIPKGVANPHDPATLIDYLIQPAIQDRTLSETGFFPVLASGTRGDVPRTLLELAAAVNKQSGSRDSLQTLIPIGLGERGDDYNTLFMLTFSQIVLEGKDTASVLDANAGELQKIIDQEDAGCWAPDVSLERPCKIE